MKKYIIPVVFAMLFSIVGGVSTVSATTATSINKPTIANISSSGDIITINGTNLSIGVEKPTIKVRSANLQNMNFSLSSSGFSGNIYVVNISSFSPEHIVFRIDNVGQGKVNSAITPGTYTVAVKTSTGTSNTVQVKVLKIIKTSIKLLPISNGAPLMAGNTYKIPWTFTGTNTKDQVLIFALMPATTNTTGANVITLGSAPLPQGNFEFLLPNDVFSGEYQIIGVEKDDNTIYSLSPFFTIKADSAGIQILPAIEKLRVQVRASLNTALNSRARFLESCYNASVPALPTTLIEKTVQISAKPNPTEAELQAQIKNISANITKIDTQVDICKTTNGTPNAPSSTSSKISTVPTQTSTHQTIAIVKTATNTQSSPQIQTIKFPRNMWEGMRSNNVKRLQHLFDSTKEFRLAESGPGSLGNETTYYGSLLRKAVQNFQCKNNIVCSGSPYSTGYGTVGPKTSEKLDELYGRNEDNTNTTTEDMSTTNTSINKAKEVAMITAQIQQLLQAVKQLQQQLALQTSSQ